MKLALCIPVINHQIETEQCIKSFKDNVDNWQDIELLIIDNGSEIPATEWGIEGVDERSILRNEKNVGVLPALQQAYEYFKYSEVEYIFFTHNDVTMFEKGWDTKIIKTLEGINAGHFKGVGVAGFYGAKGLGTSELYVRDYQMHQLVRVENVSNCNRMPAGHNYRNIKGPENWEQVAVMDGFSLIVSTKFLNEQNGFDTNLPAHHMYDNHTCMQAIDRGYMNIVIAMDAVHHGGVTDVSENWNEPFGLDKAEIHRLAHYPYFYNYWKRGGHDNQNVTLPYMTQ